LIENALREEIESQVGPFVTEGLDIRVEIRWGNPWLEITYEVLRGGYDLVIKAASGADAKRRPFIGSTALHLIRKCPCPVWIVGSVWDGSGGRILAAVDPSDEGTRPDHGQEILNWGLSLAGEGGELHAASAWRASGETLLRGRVRPGELDDYVRSSEEYAQAGLDKLLASIGNPLHSERVHLLKGHPREVLTNFAEQWEFDLVVLGSVGRVGVAGLLIGETAETFIRSVRASVFTVKPPGFVSPVQLPAD
jgi:nucleotide-binding universal stress UspA family protein